FALFVAFQRLFQLRLKVIANNLSTVHTAKGNKWCTLLGLRVRVIDDDRFFRLKGSFYELGLLSIAVPIVAKAVFADMLVRICKTGTEEGTLSGTLYADEDNQ